MLLTTVQVPSHPLPLIPLFSNRILNVFRVCNELYDGTLNHFHSYASTLTSELVGNEVFTFTQAMRQDDGMMKEVREHEE